MGRAPLLGRGGIAGGAQGARGNTEIPRGPRVHIMCAQRAQDRQIDSQSAALPPLSLPERTSTVPISQWAARTSLSACKQEAGARPGGWISRSEGVVSLCGAAARPTTHNTRADEGKASPVSMPSPAPTSPQHCCLSVMNHFVMWRLEGYLFRIASRQA